MADYPTAHEQRAREVQREQARLEREFPGNAPFGGYRNTAVRTIAARERVNPYELDRQIRPFL